ncbi:MAG: peptidase [Phenylobacterium sp.]|nr:peptidase [Phenylobacterium sp.]
MRIVTFAIILGTLAATAAGAAIAPRHGALKGHALSGQAKVSLAQARAIVMKARVGDITDQALEKDPGGSGLRYAFDLASRGATQEVGVDALTGRVIRDGPKNPPEAAAQQAQDGLADPAPPSR